MENEDHSQAGRHSGGQVPRDEAKRLAGYEWSEFERDLETLGRQLSELGVHTAVRGDQLVQSLQAQYQKVKTGANAWKRATERQVDDISNSAWRQGGEAQRAYSDMRERSKAAAHDIWERSEPLRQGARDVGASFGKAAGRISSSEPSTPDRPADERREAN